MKIEVSIWGITAITSGWPVATLGWWWFLFRLGAWLRCRWLKKWAINNLIAYDQTWNARTLGDPDETISSRVGKLRDRRGGKLPWWLAWMVFLEWIDPHHFKDTQEPDEGGDAVWR